jgi:hypothetical protein
MTSSRCHHQHVAGADLAQEAPDPCSVTIAAHPAASESSHFGRFCRRLGILQRFCANNEVMRKHLSGRNANFRSLRDPIDTSTPQGMFSLLVLGAVAQLERSLISERTKAGVQAAKSRGRLPGNAGLRSRKPLAIAKTAAARRATYDTELVASMDVWMQPAASPAQLGRCGAVSLT